MASPSMTCRRRATHDTLLRTLHTTCQACSSQCSQSRRSFTRNRMSSWPRLECGDGGVRPAHDRGGAGKAGAGHGRGLIGDSKALAVGNWLPLLLPRHLRISKTVQRRNRERDQSFAAAEAAESATHFLEVDSVHEEVEVMAIYRTWLLACASASRLAKPRTPVRAGDPAEERQTMIQTPDRGTPGSRCAGAGSDAGGAAARVRSCGNAGPRLRSPAPAHRRRPDNLAALHRGVHEGGARVAAEPARARDRGRARATRRQCWRSW